MTMTEAVVARVDDILKEREMSRRKHAKASNLSEGTMGNIFKKVAKSAPLSTLKAICDALGVSMLEFLDCEYFKSEKRRRKNLCINLL